jgi:hypothetical protein
MSLPRDLIAEVLLAPELTLRLPEMQWDLLIRQGRSSNLLARLAHLLVEQRLIDGIKPAFRHHLVSALQMAKRQDIALHWEVGCLRDELADAQVKIILLKGAAYGMARLPFARGRTFSDIDILVPKAQLGGVERELMVHGWQGGHHDAYDQRYYRQWMHEIPPLRHVRRGTTVDVHHTILPETARVKVNTPALFDAVVAVPGHENVYVLAPADMLLHSATHLFHEGEFEKGLRDLFDLDGLLRHFGADPGFWAALVPRAQMLGLTRPLFYALLYTRMMLGTPVPEPVFQAAVAAGRPAAPVAWLVDACYPRALRPVHASSSTLGTWPARFSLYVRSHWIRMPWYLLTYHLGRKALLRMQKPEEDKTMDALAGAGK